MYDAINTDYDVMKEYLIYGAELDEKYGIPILPPISIYPKETVDFEESFSKKIKGHKELTVNFYIQDSKFIRLWNNPDKYLDHLSCFHSVIMPDFSIATGQRGMPFALNLYNKYRNHALAWRMCMNGIKVIPSVSIPDGDNYDWCFTGLPQNSTLAVCTNGRVKSKAGREEFCQGFYEMCVRLSPTRIIIVGRIPDELKTDLPIINLKSRNMKIERKGQNGNINR